MDSFYFKNVVFFISLFSLINYKKINNKIDEKTNKKNNLLIKYVIYFIPILVMINYELQFLDNDTKLLHPLKNFGKNNKIKYIIEILGAYGIVQVLSQDLGIKTGILQRNLIQHPLVQFLILYSGAYLIGRRLNQALIATLIFFVLKYNISNNINSNVCFEDV
jgi:hypothetical protein